MKKLIKTGYLDHRGETIFSSSKVEGQISQDPDTQFCTKLSWRTSPPSWLVPVATKRQVPLGEAVQFLRLHVTEASTPIQKIK